MWVFVDRASQTPVHVSGVVNIAGQLYLPPLADALAQAAAVTGLPEDQLIPYQVTELAEAEAIAEAFARRALMATVETVQPEAPEGEEPPPPEDVVTGVMVDPDWQPPEPAPDPVQTRLEALEAAVTRQEAAVAANLLASPHDRRWLAQKERAKLFGVSWIKANPTAAQTDLESAVMADLAATFPDQPLVVSGGVILSYAAEAHARGYIADPGFEAMRDMVVAASAEQIQAMLSVL